MLELLDPKSLDLSKADIRDVSQKSTAYLELRESIREHGVLKPVLVRQKGLQLIDGKHRVTAALDLGLDKVPANVVDCNKFEARNLGLLLNVHTIPMSENLVNRALSRLVENNNLSVRELSKMLGKTPAWVRRRLELEGLNPIIRAAIDDGLAASKALILKDLPKEELPYWLEKAKDLSASDLSDLVDLTPKSTGIKGEFAGLKAKVRAVQDLKKELANPKRLRTLVPEDQVPAAMKGIEFALQIDEYSLEERRLKLDASQSKRRDRKIERLRYYEQRSDG